MIADIFLRPHAFKKMNPQIKKILFATDLSKNSAYAYYYAVSMAKKEDAKIVILHAVDPIPSMLITPGDFSQKVAKDRWEEAVKKFKERIEEISIKMDTRMGTSSVDLVSNILIRLGHPVEEILKTADEEGCDVIVLGTRGKGLLKQTLLGSVSGSILIRTRKPLFIIPMPTESTNTDLI